MSSRPTRRRRRRPTRRAPGVATRFLGFGTAVGIGFVVAFALAIGISATAAPALVRSIVAAVPAVEHASTTSTTQCPKVAPVVVDSITVPSGPVAGYCQDRLINAAHIMAAAKTLGIGTHTQAIGVMTAMGESSLVNIDHGDVAGPDSRGLFQQRDNGAWGSYSDRMTPTIAATHFFQKLVRIPDWKSLTPTEAAHRVQVNADPNHYASYWPAAVDVVAALSGS
jgi:hypothetical protein